MNEFVYQMEEQIASLQKRQAEERNELINSFAIYLRDEKKQLEEQLEGLDQASKKLEQVIKDNKEI